MIYHVHSERIGVGRRVARVVFLLIVYVLVMWVVHLYWSRGGSKSRSLEEYIVEGAVFAAIAFFADSIRREYDLEVDDEIIRMRGAIDSRQVRRGRIRCMWEQKGTLLREGGLWLSERRGIGKLFSGSVFIPASLPDFEKIKATAASWMEIG